MCPIGRDGVRSAVACRLGGVKSLAPSPGCALIWVVAALKGCRLAITAGLTLSVGCGAPSSASGRDTGSAGATSLTAQAGFVDVQPRDVIVHGRPVSLAATSKIFYNFRPADTDAETRPLIVLFNGFASDVVRAFGTGPNSVQPDGSVAPNPDSLTRQANLLYLEPRQAGFSYDVLDGRAPSASDCSQDVFSEYVDAADVLLATLQFSKQHSALRGPVYWLGESYAGVRISWMIAYLRQAWSLAPYEDEALQRAIAGVERDRYLSGQILLQPWLIGAAHASAIQSACQGSGLLAAVQASIASPCTSNDACVCARANARSPYDYTLSAQELNARLFAADAAQVSPMAAEALYGVEFDTIVGLRGSERARGFKCSSADAETPEQSALVALLGALPEGQSYNLAYSPLTPGKGSTNPDWRTQTLIGTAFLANVEHVPTLVTDGQRDLVVPEVALAPALRSISGPVTISESLTELTLGYPSGARAIAVRHYPSAGHMVTINEPRAFAADLSEWLDALSP
jgi:pimeloyl-ACP methyl ester carboxylesterase